MELKESTVCSLESPAIIGMAQPINLLLGKRANQFREGLCAFVRKISNGEDNQSYKTRDFISEDGQLYQYNPTRSHTKMKLLICVTMYNECAQDLDNTLTAIYQNLRQFEALGVPRDAIGVVVVFDGIEHTHRSVVDYLSTKIEVGDRINNVAERRKQIAQTREHEKLDGFRFPSLFPRRVALCYQSRIHFGRENASRNMNVYFLFKHDRGGKLSSHLWFLHGFCRYFEPSYISFIDVGTQPAPDAIFKLFTAMEANQKLGGVCGFLDVANPSSFDLTGAQLFEYTMGHIIDKACESVFGFIQVLPGSFSAYRWEAINDRSILGAYLDKVLDPSFMFSEHYTCPLANMYLAEDRLLCLSVFARLNHRYSLKYLPDARARTDVPTKIEELMNQRRRWMNGHLFALDYVWKNSSAVSKSGHTKLSVLMFYLGIAHSIYQSTLLYFSVGIYYLIFHLCTEDLLSEENLDHSWLSTLILNSYLSLLAFALLISLVYKVAEVPKAYKILAHFFALSNLVVFAFVALYLMRALTLDDTYSLFPNAFVAVTLILFASYMVPVIINGEIRSVCKGSLAFIYYFPVYLHLFIIYAYANFDDTSWGTREEAIDVDPQWDEKLEKKRDEFKQFKVRKLGIWTLSNIFLVSILISVSESGLVHRYLLITLFITVSSLTMAMKTLLAAIYKIKYVFWDRVLVNAYLERTRKAGQVENIVRSNYIDVAKSLTEQGYDWTGQKSSCRGHLIGGDPIFLDYASPSMERKPDTSHPKHTPFGNIVIPERSGEYSLAQSQTISRPPDYDEIMDGGSYKGSELGTVLDMRNISNLRSPSEAKSASNKSSVLYQPKQGTSNDFSHFVHTAFNS